MLARSAVGFAADQSPAPPASSAHQAELDTVTVEARRQRQLLEKQVSTYVSQITMSTREEALLRWSSPICPAVAGLDAAQGEYVLGRISQVVTEARAPLGPEDCTPNFLTIVSTDPGAVIEKWWDHHPRMFNSDRGIGGIKEFIESSRPIRAWYNASLGCEGGAYRVRGGGTYIPTHCAGSSESRLSWLKVRVISSVIVLVDARRVAGLNIRQIADYVALLGTAQIRANAKPGDAPSILHLFDAGGGARPEGLTRWDQAFLKALYSTPATDALQVAEIKNHLDQELIP